MSTGMVGPAGGPLAAAAASQAAPGGGGGGGGSAVEHLLALKVMRLTRPTLATPLVVTADPRTDLLRDSLNAELRCEATALRGAEELCLGQTLVLPQSFGNIYLGETFTSYVSLHNDSTDACRKVSLRCDLQTATQRIPLYPSSSGASQAAESFPPGGSVDVVLNHEVKELGAHILVCEVHYAAPHRDKLNFRKFFKFQVMKPLDVKTKFYNAESDEVFLEAQVQNVTLGPLCLEKVSLEPSQLFDVASLNETAADGGDSDLDSDDGNSSSDKKKTVSVFGRVNCIQPQDSRQYLFCLTPRPDVRANHKLLKSVTSIGKLDIVWRTNLGDRGRLQTSQLQRMAPSHGEVRFAVESAPSIALLNRAFTIKGRIINNCDRTLELELNLLNLHHPHLTWSGTTATKLGLVEPSGQTEVSVDVVPHRTGLQAVSGVRLTDSLLKRTYEFDDFCQVFVCQDDALMEAISL